MGPCCWQLFPFSAYQDSNAVIKFLFRIDVSFTSVALTIESLRDEINLVVLEKCDLFENRSKVDDSFWLQVRKKSDAMNIFQVLTS